MIIVLISFHFDCQAHCIIANELMLNELYAVMHVSSESISCQDVVFNILNNIMMLLILYII